MILAEAIRRTHNGESVSYLFSHVPLWRRGSAHFSHEGARKHVFKEHARRRGLDGPADAAKQLLRSFYLFPVCLFLFTLCVCSAEASAEGSTLSPHVAFFVWNDAFIPDRDDRSFTASPPVSAWAACGRTLRSARVNVVTGSLTDDLTSRCERSAVVPTSCHLRKRWTTFL